MAESIIRRIDEEDPRAGGFIHEGFTRYGEKNNVITQLGPSANAGIRN